MELIEIKKPEPRSINKWQQSKQSFSTVIDQPTQPKNSSIASQGQKERPRKSSWSRILVSNEDVNLGLIKEDVEGKDELAKLISKYKGKKQSKENRNEDH